MFLKKNLLLNIKFTLKSCKLFASTESLISCSQLFDFMKKPLWYESYRILDAQWDLKNEDYRAKHLSKRIFGSKYFSFDECCDKKSAYPRMLPSENYFEEYVSNLGITNNHHVIIYDNHEVFALYSAPRVWWMFQAFGHEKVSVLNGGLRKWVEAGFPTVTGPYANEELEASKKHYKASLNYSWVKDFEWIQKNSNSTLPVQVVDARNRNRFLGIKNDGSIDKEGGHIPSSLSIPFEGLFDKVNNSLLGKDLINKYFADNYVDTSKDIVASCGSAVSACILSFALHHSCDRKVPVYDGSWSEWKVRATPDSLVRIVN
ncbi:thiosulfate sulfurtransferase [Hydra vulgaris]|uniref:Sulfurtransferase n=1 Tax=Hydra vulgaris TaxID=6087 RepID=A0ABM4CKE2_HYDVU